MKKNLYNTIGFTWAIIAFVLICLILFSPSFFSAKSIFAGDAPGLVSKEYKIENLIAHYIGNWSQNSIGAGSGATPMTPLRIARDLLTFTQKHQEITYIIAVLFTCLGTAYYLAALGVSRKVRYTAGIALAFSGYSFTLIAAGHNGFFQMMAYVVFLFGFIERGIRTQRFIYFALMGTFVMWGISAQPDMMIPFSILASVYALFSFILQLREKPRHQRVSLIRTTLAGGLIAILFVGLFGLSSFRFLFETVVPQRDKESGQTAEEKWVFSTNWSFPPGEMIEFISPRIFGNDSEDREYPYWGALGRPHNWEKSFKHLQQQYQLASTNAQKTQIAQQIQGMLRNKNFRQHNTYLGVIPITFSLFAFCWAITQRRRDQAKGLENDIPINWRPYIFFWAAVVVVSILFAFGRYAPFYKLPYTIPYLNKLRAPVKYLRVAEIGLCFLFGLGAAIYFNALDIPALSAKEKKKIKTEPDSPNRKLFSAFYILSLVIACGFLFALVVSFRTRLDLNQTWDLLGLNAFKNALFARYCFALLHSALLFSVLAVLFYFSRIPKHHTRLKTIVPGLLLLVVAIDVTVSSYPYIRVRDKSAYYAPNPMAEYMKEKNPFYRADILLPTPYALAPLARTWFYHEIRTLRPSSRSTPQRTRDFFNALANTPQRLWFLTSTPFVMGDRKQLGAQSQQLGLAEVMPFNIEGDYYTSFDNSKARFALYEHYPVMDPATVFHRTIPVDADLALKTLSDPGWNPATTLLTEFSERSLGGSETPSPANIVKRTWTKTIVETTLKEPGILMVTEKYHPDIKTYVNGKPQPLVRCNAVMQGVELPPGHHTVKFIYRPYLAVFYINLAATLFVLAWWAAVAYRGAKGSTSTPPAAKGGLNSIETLRKPLVS